MRTILVIIALLGSSASFAQTAVYRWVDAQGEVHYSDRPVEGAKLVTTTKPTPPGAPVPAAVKTAQAAGDAAVADANKDIAAQQNARAVNQDVAAQRAKQCKDATTRYEKSVQARRIYRTAPNGEREYLSDAEADQLRQQNRAAMTSACGNA
jgi:hypothetical protein